MTRILVLNNFSIENVWQDVKAKQTPDHVLFGINYFHQRGFEVELLPFNSSKFLQNLNSVYRKTHFPIPLGDLDQQFSCLKRLNHADLIYSPCQTQTQLLAYFRGLGLIKVPIVCVAHHYLNTGRLAFLREPFVKLMLKGVDAFPSLSRRVAELINQTANQINKSEILAWGPDANFYSYYSYRVTKGSVIVCAGRTGRDFYTFGMAASQTKVKARIICLENSYSENFQRFGTNVEVTIRPNTDEVKHYELLEVYANSRVIAIPLHVGNGTSLVGLTSLMDALGMGKPVIMTRHPLVDLDIEAEGIGIWVEPGDINGWIEAIKFFEENEDEALAMGMRARNLVKNGLNSSAFANQIMNIFENVLLKE